MNRILFLATLVSIALISSGCAVQGISKSEAFPQMYDEKPVAIMVVPSINHSTAADAPILYSSTINEPLSNAGFYVLPIELTDRFLRSEGLSEGEMVKDIPPQNFAEPFGADAVLYVTIEKWDTNYMVFAGNVTVAIDFQLKSTKTGQRLWGYTDQLVLDTTNNDQSSSLIAKLISTAISTAVQDYVPIARRVNLMALNAIPYGKYHNMHDKDQLMKVSTKKVGVD